MRHFLLFCFLLFFMSAPLCAQTVEEFTAGLDKVDARIASGRWKSAHKELEKLLVAHEGHDYVRVRKIEIENRRANIDFGLHYKPPKIQDLVSGKISYSASSGKIKLRYTPPSMADFDSYAMDKDGDADRLEKKQYVHPAIFNGPYSITIKGSKYPVEAGRAAILACLDAEHSINVNFGYQSETRGGPVRRLPVTMTALIDEILCEVDRREKSPAKKGKPFNLKVSVSNTLVSAAYNGKHLVGTRRPKGCFGQLGFYGFSFEEVVIEGKVEPSWIEGLQDGAALEARRIFEQSYDVRAHLPDWIYQKISASRPSPAFDRPAKYPGPQSEAAQSVFERVQRYIDQEDIKNGLSFVQDLSAAQEIAKSLTEYLMTLLFFAMDDYDRSLTCCSRVVELEPGFFPARQAQAALTTRVGRRSKAIELYRSLVADYPGQDDIHLQLATLLLRAGEPEQAKSVIDAAIALGCDPDPFDSLNRQLIKAINGPDWGATSDWESDHYHVIADLDRATCHEACKLLEESYTAYTVYLQRIKDPEKRKFRVYLFSGQAGFNAYCEDVLGMTHDWAAGVYSPMLKQLLIWNLPNNEQMMTTVRHEGFHQYLDRLMDNPPLWFNEGLAEYYEIAGWKDGRRAFGSVHTEHLNILFRARKSLIPLKEFIYGDRKQFDADTSLSYAQSWALIHFLRHGPRKYRKIFDRLFDAFQEDLSNKDALDEVFGDVDLDRMENEFRRYVREMR